MSCIYKYKNKIYTESQIKDLILERDILKNHPIVTFIKKLFKTLPFQYKENLLNEGSKKYGIERGESTATIKYSLADQNKVEYGLKAIEILHSDKAIQIFEKGKKNNWSLDKILTELQIPKEQKQLILDLGITDREKIALELASKYSFVVEINTAKKEYSKNYTRGNQTPTEDRPYGNNTFEINNVEYSSNIMDGGYKKYENGKYYNITAEEYKKAFDSFEKTYETIPTIYYSNLTVHGGTNYTENEISTPLITPSIKGHTLFSTNNGIGWFRSDDKVDGLDTNIYDSKDIPAGIMNVTGEYGEFFRKEKGGDWYVSTNEGDINVSKTAMPDEFITDAFNEQYSINRNKLQLTKTRRILELQSDLFQKGRDKEDLTEPYIIETYNNQGRPERREESNPNNKNQNQFLQLLNKDNNWVTFFVKSIIQDTAKQTITEVQQEDVEAKVRELEKEGLLEIDCKGKLKAEKGLTTSFTKGGTWKVIKDLKGYPTHKEGGVDLTIGKNGVSIKNGNTQFTAKYGLVIPKN